MKSLARYIEEFTEALNREINYQKEQGGRAYHIHDGRLLLQDRGEWVYLFIMEHEVSLPDGSPVRVEVGRQVWAGGEVIGLDGFELIVTLDHNLGQEVREASLYCEPWELLVALQQRLQEIPSRNVALVIAVLTGTPVALGPSRPREKKSSGAPEPIRFVLSNAVAFVWGPPGTGKTESLARIATELWAEGEQVLILSHSNVAIDEAVARIAGRTDSFKEGKLVRYGFAQPKFLLERRELTSFYLATRLRPELMEGYEKLLAERERLKRSGSLDRLAQVEQELSRYRRDIRAGESLVIEAAEVVGTTLSKSAADQAVSNHRWDTVIVDEASMAYIPHVAYAASLAARRIVVVGDFRQLAPIALRQGDPVVDRWLRRDIFEEAGIVEAVERHDAHPCLRMLDVQHRMHPKIAGFASTGFYGGRLKDAPGMADRVAHIVNAKPFPREPLVLLDLSELEVRSVMDREKSRFNLISAFVSVAVAAAAHDQEQIAIITPYRAQARLLRALLSDVFGAKIGAAANRCRAATVHRFQGSQAELVIFDLVDASGRPGTLVSSSGESPRLVNVAVTRAQGKLVVVCKRSYIEEALGHHVPSRQLVSYIKEKGAHLRVLEALNSGLLPRKDGQLEWLTDEGKALERLRNELQKAERIRGLLWADWIISSAGEALGAEVARFAKSNRDVYIWTDKPAAIKGVLPENCLGSRGFVPFGATLLLDSQSIWYAVYAPSWERNLWIRYGGEKGVACIAGFLELDARKPKGLAAFIKSVMTCPECGSPATHRFSKKNRGRVFLGCSGYPSCSWTSTIAPEIVEVFIVTVGLACPSCGGKPVARVGKHGVFVGCSNFPRCGMTMSIAELL